MLKKMTVLLMAVALVFSSSLMSVMASEAETGSVSDSLALDKEALIAEYPGQFEQLVYEDEQTGLSITYNLFLPEGYDETGAYPMVVFIGDSSCAGGNPEVSLTQGRGALVWASDEWQAVYPTIVAVPTYPETILDDHGSYTTTEYVELTKRYIDYMCGAYAVDAQRVYGTGQSMGCMTTLILASEYPDLYAACMFVDGQWDITTLSGLESQTFVYFAAEDDANAWNGAQEVMQMFDADEVSYAYAQWDGNWTPEELSEAAAQLFSEENDRYFISWLTGTIEPKSGGMGGNVSSAGSENASGESAEGESAANENAEGESAANENAEGESAANENAEGESAANENAEGESAAGESAEGENASGESSGSVNSSAYHMASFDYAYNCIAVMEWVINQ